MKLVSSGFSGVVGEKQLILHPVNLPEARMGIYWYRKVTSMPVCIETRVA